MSDLRAPDSNTPASQGNRLRRKSPLPRLRISSSPLLGSIKRLDSLASSELTPLPASILHSVDNLRYKGQQITARANNFETVATLGSGAFGTVDLMRIRHRKEIRMAVKRIRYDMSDEERKIIEMDVEVIKSCGHHPNIVDFYGVFLFEGDIWICMELMDISMDAFYKLFNEIKHDEAIPESLLRQLILDIVQALEFLRIHEIIHRDVKPSNFLANKSGEFKLCDFGISGRLVDSVAKTFNKGCRPYFAPERIEPLRPYDIRSDVWSLGISIIEIANAKHPYSGTIFTMLRQLREGIIPELENEQYSDNLRDFVSICLTKDVANRPDYVRLLKHPLISDRRYTIDQHLLDVVNDVILEHQTQLGLLDKHVCEL